MSLASNINILMQKEMSRQEFLLVLGLGIASIFGFSTIIHLLTGKSVESRLHSRLRDGNEATNYGR
jgi:hypothetical protein